MLMAHSVEGRFPFLDVNVAELAASLPPRYKLSVLDEKHVLKRVAKDLVPKEILQRKKQPYRVPDAVSFASSSAPQWVFDNLSESSIASAGIFDNGSVQKLVRKCRAAGLSGEPLSNSDNMAFLGVLSTQLLVSSLIQNTPSFRPVEPKTSIVFAASGE